MISAGSIVLAEIQQNDGRIKRRPALVVKIIPPFNDYLLCAISSQVRLYQEELDILINRSYPFFSETGLKTDSIIRGGYLATVSSDYIPGAIGSIDEKVYQQLLNKISSFLRNY